jgi:hypothetical protein
MLRYSHPWLGFVLDYWPATVLLPTVLLLIVVLALITRWWDRRDSAAARAPATRADCPADAINLFDARLKSDRVTAA